MAVKTEVKAEDDKLLTSEQVADLLSMSVRTLWRLIAKGKFPEPIRYNRKMVRWKNSQVQEYLRNLR